MLLGLRFSFGKRKSISYRKNIENKLVSNNLKDIRKKGCSLLSQYYHVIPVHIDIPITQHALMLPDQGQRGCKVTHPSTHLDKNQNTHLKNFFHWTIHYPNIFLLYCLAIPKYWWYIISKNGISSSSYNSVSHWSCACFYFSFIWFLLMINFQHPTVTKVVG